MSDVSCSHACLSSCFPVCVRQRVIGWGLLSSLTRRGGAGAEGGCSRSARCQHRSTLQGTATRPGHKEPPYRIKAPAGSRLQHPGVLKRANPGVGLIGGVGSEPAAGETLHTFSCQSIIYNLALADVSYMVLPEGVWPPGDWNSMLFNTSLTP